VERRARAAYADLRFASAATEIASRTVVAHVRAATVGDVSMANTHPFRSGPWVFAHNGTITAFHRVARLLGPVSPAGPAPGTTDSAYAFRWILAHMPEAGLDPERPATAIRPLVRLLSTAVSTIARATRAAGAAVPPRLNFLLSDGRHLVASRWGNSLWWTFRRGISDCAACGRPHPVPGDEPYRAIVVASEPISDEPWHEVQEGSIVAVDGDVRLTTWDLLVRAA